MAAVNITLRDCDLGTAHTMRPAATRPELIELGRGTLMENLLRRFRHPIGLAGGPDDCAPIAHAA